ncbi:LysR family transcriptional regulator [Aureimonas endophytica]|uniref:LysR family transcriptional regulator n=1 Tax=Aureimonas endophytica TaxID=2027858 RepID=A0A917EAM5_9HYPH|nr:LysR family transcriptional regulator [Aureimonas endophytica]GGE15475.1 LysR family transcriptional regulator [Aureimonas endophytica]
MSEPVIDWNDQRAFLAVLDTGSLSAAARALGLTQPTVRHRIEALERAVGQPLFTRGVNGLQPTEEARGLADPVRRMAFASEAFRRAVASEAREIAGTVRISVADFVGIEVLPPMLAGLRERHPRLSIELALSNVSADLLHQEADLAIRMVAPRQDALVARHVGRIALGFFAAPAYAERHGLPATLAELSDHALIGPDRAMADLAFVEALAATTGQPFRFTLRTDSHPAQLAAVRAGLGIGIAHIRIGSRDLRRVLPDFVLHHLDTWIVAHEDLRRSRRVDAVFRHLVAAFQAYCGPAPYQP